MTATSGGGPRAPPNDPAALRHIKLTTAAGPEARAISAHLARAAPHGARLPFPRQGERREL